MIRKLLLLAALLSGVAGAQTHRVQAGESLYAIARANGTTVARLMTLNGLRSTTIRPGQVLQLGGERVNVQRPATGTAVQRGIASYYYGRHDCCTRYVAAHRTLPFGTWVRVTNLNNGRWVLVKINDRGPFIRGRVIDVSNEAAAVLRITSRGLAPVSVQVVSRP